MIHSNKNNNEKITVLLEESEICIYKNLDRSLKLIQSAFDLANANDYFLSHIHYLFARYYKFNSEFDKAKKHANESITLSILSNNRFVEGRSMLELGILEESDDLLSSEEFHKKALKIFRDINDFEGEVLVLNSLSCTQIEAGENEKAYELINEALIISNQHKLSNMLSPLYYGLGLISFNSHDWSTSQDFFQRSYSEAIKQTNRRDIINSLIGLASSYLYTDKGSEALILIEEALNESKKLGSKFFIADMQRYLGIANSQLKDYNAAIEWNLQSLSIFLELDRQDYIIDIYTNLSQAYSELGAWEKVDEYFERVQFMYEKQREDWKPKILDTLMIIMKNRKNFEQALQYSEEKLKLHDKLFSSKMKKQINSLKLKLQLEKEVQEKEIHKLKTSQLEQELANSALHLATQTEMLGNFRNEMRAIVREINEPIAALKKIKEKLKELPCESVDWTKFEKEFTAVHPEFRAKLTEKYPELTKQEIKMCQLARLGLKTYEMSRLLCLSERTIDGHRNSLRKKLGLKPQENLKDFLQQIR